MLDHPFLPDSFGRDFCTKKLDERGRVVTCCAPLRDHEEQPARPRLPEAWLVDAAGSSVRFCRPHETLSFNSQTARAFAAALLAAADEAERA